MPNILVLRIYNSTPDYDEMKKFHMEYDDSIFVTMNPNIDTEWKYTESERLIEVRGHETYIPGILDKTVVGIKACLELFDFDFLVRSNASTVVDTSELEIQLSPYSRTQHLYGGHTWPLERIDGKLQFTTVEWLGRGLPFVTGTGIILSRVTSQYIVDNAALLDKSIVDDVAIAVLLESLQKTHLVVLRSEEVGIVKGCGFYRFRTTSPRPWMGVYTFNPDRNNDIRSVGLQYKLMGDRLRRVTQTPCAAQCALPRVPAPTT